MVLFFSFSKAVITSHKFYSLSLQFVSELLCPIELAIVLTLTTVSKSYQSNNQNSIANIFLFDQLTNVRSYSNLFHQLINRLGIFLFDKLQYQSAVLLTYDQISMISSLSPNVDPKLFLYDQFNILSSRWLSNRQSITDELSLQKPI